MASPLKMSRIMPLLLSCGLAQQMFCAEPRAGQVVWWGQDVTPRATYSEHTNGVIESGNEILSNVVAIAAGHGTGLALKNDSTVFAWGLNLQGRNDVPSGLSNVVSIAVEGNSSWAVKHDGTVARWGNSDQDGENIVAGLSNVVSITWAGYRSYLALKNDGTVFGFRFDNSEPSNGSGAETAVRPVRIRGQALSNVVALASMGYTPLVLKSDSAVVCLGYQTLGAPPAEPVVTVVDERTIGIDMGGESAKTPYQYTSADPVVVDGRPLSNVVALATSGVGPALALRKDGTVVTWGERPGGGTPMPAGLSKVVAVATDGGVHLALKRDGTVMAWGENNFGEASVPGGLSNVVAIVAGGPSLALTTGNVPSNVYIQPHGRLEEMEREADLIFKGRAISSSAITNNAFRVQAEVRETTFELISVLKGNLQTNLVTFQHYATSFRGGWSGPLPPEYYRFEIGQPYLIFAARLDRPDTYYDPTLVETSVGSNVFRQVYRNGVMRTLDARPVETHSVKDAHWFELNLLLNDANPTNALYAIDQLDSMSLAGRSDDQWRRSDDFKRKAVLSALLPLLTNNSEQVASRAISFFAVESNPAATLEPFAGSLIKIANESSSSKSRLSAIGALSGIHCEAVSNSLAQLLENPDENIRVGAVTLLPHFPDEFAEQALREMAADKSPKVRAAVAEGIGNGKIVALLPTLERLWNDPIGREKPLLIDLDALKAGGRSGSSLDSGDVHTCTGYALLNFDLDHVGEFLKANLSDESFRLSFIRKLAPNGAGPYFPLLAKELKTHTAGSEQEAAKNGFHWSLSYWLLGNFGWAWDTLFGYVSAQTREALADPQMVPMLDALQIADDPDDARTRSLYGFFLDKGLIERAIELRRGITRRTEDKAIDKASFNFPSLLKAFDEIDEKHSLKPGLGR